MNYFMTLLYVWFRSAALETTAARVHGANNALLWGKGVGGEQKRSRGSCQMGLKWVLCFLEFLWGGGWGTAFPHQSDTELFAWSPSLPRLGSDPEFGLKGGIDDPGGHFQLCDSLCTSPASSTAARSCCTTTGSLPSCQNHSSPFALGGFSVAGSHKIPGGNLSAFDGSAPLQLELGWPVFFLFSFFSLIASGYISCVFAAGKWRHVLFMSFNIIYFYMGVQNWDITRDYISPVLFKMWTWKLLSLLIKSTSALFCLWKRQF